MEQDEQWSTGKRYFDMTAYWHWRGHGLELEKKSDSETQTRPLIPRGVE
jgi:hypothetical protein